MGFMHRNLLPRNGSESIIKKNIKESVENQTIHAQTKKFFPRYGPQATGRQDQRVIFRKRPENDEKTLPPEIRRRLIRNSGRNVPPRSAYVGKSGGNIWA